MFFQRRRPRRFDPASAQLCKRSGGRSVVYENYLSAGVRLYWSYAQDSLGLWHSRRVPNERTFAYPADGAFYIAGMRYGSLAQLILEPDGQDGFRRDIYGRRVLHILERFPCFDSFDLMYEDRFYHWYLLCERDRLHRVFCADEDEFLYVTEDVELLELDCCGKLEELGLLGKGIAAMRDIKV